MNAQANDKSSEKAPLGGHHEVHYVTRTGWLRAAVLGANDGLLSTGSLMAGVAAASVAPGQLVLTGVAGIVAGALSMAAGEYVSVSSQADSEKADLVREATALREHPRQELHELAAIYRARGLDADLAQQVAIQLHDTDPLDAHKRDELGLHEGNEAKPVQAALASALTFLAGGVVPLIMALLLPGPNVLYAIGVATVITLAVLGAAGARAGGAKMLPATIRVVVLGSLAMALTAGVGTLFHATI
ncbi:VIT family protein [Novosphingobium sp.]|uniref:VIT1/CCC1 transporter family protein n=1 Tax=Novosphingobium sp. TaxID=1874826 RepID=UPI0025ED3FD2|nr:VIT family protein [Novosphingobium sp.]